MAIWREVYSAVAVFAIVVSVVLGAVACAPDNVARDKDGDAGKDSFRTIVTPTPGTASADVGIVHAVTFSDGTEEVVPQSELIALEDARYASLKLVPLYAAKTKRTIWPFSKTQREFVGWFTVDSGIYDSGVPYRDEGAVWGSWPDRQKRLCDPSVFGQTDGDWTYHPEGHFCSYKDKLEKVAPGSFLGHFKGRDVYCEPYYAHRWGLSGLTRWVWRGPMHDSSEHAGHCFGPQPLRPPSDTTLIHYLPEFRDLYPFATATPNPYSGDRNQKTRLIVGKDIMPGLYLAFCDWPEPPDFIDRCSIEFRLKLKPGDDDFVSGWVVSTKGWSGRHGSLLVNVHACDREIVTDFSYFEETDHPEDLQRAADSFPSNFRGGVYERLRAESLEFYGDNCGRDAE